MYKFSAKLSQQWKLYVKAVLVFSIHHQSLDIYQYWPAMGYVWTSEDSSGHKAISHMLFHAKFQVDGQFVFALIEKVKELLLQNFVHAMTAHVQNSVVTGWLETESQEKKYFHFIWVFSKISMVRWCMGQTYWPGEEYFPEKTGTCWWNQMSTWTAFRSHIRDKSITRSSHLYDGVPYIHKMASLKWNLHAGWQYKKQWNQHAFCIPKLTWLYQILNDVRS